MVTALTLVHVLNSLLLIVVVLLQSSKGGGLAGAFGGGGGTDAVFGGRGAGTFLSKATTVLAVVFMLTSLSLTVIGRRGTEAQDSVLRRALQEEGRATMPTAGLPQAPAAPAAGEEGTESAPPAAAEEGGAGAGGESAPEGQ